MTSGKKDADSRPDPDALLALWKDSQPNQAGRLKIFLGMCPGVGKTYSMLESAQRLRKEGMDVVAGVIETHGRNETTALVEGLEILPRAMTQYRGIQISEFDLDGALKRRPQIILIDELAHTNADGCRHKKRYQDVLELIDAGISVITTLNVQHIESRVDVVQQITGVTMRETVPDSILDRANEMELVDLPPDELRKRLAAGHVYMGENKNAAAANFFREENLTALREMALRYTAERVDRDLQDVMSAKRIRGAWKTRERFLVGVSASPYSESLIRWTRSAARRSNCPWFAVHINDGSPRSAPENERLSRNLSLARHLGAEVLLVNGQNFVDTFIQVAREHHVTNIVVGRPMITFWSRFLRQSLADRLITKSRGIDVSVVCSESRTEMRWETKDIQWRPPTGSIREFGWGAGIVCLLTVGAFRLTPVLGYETIGLMFLFVIVGLGFFLGPLPNFGVAILAALFWNYCFIPPIFTFTIGQPHDMMMFVTFVIIALAMGNLTSRLRRREREEARRERRTATLLRFIQKTVQEASIADALRTGVQEIDSVFDTKCVIIERTLTHKLSEIAFPGSSYFPSEKDRSVADWVFNNRQPAGRDTDTLAQAEAMYFPLIHLERAYGVVGVKRENPFAIEERVLLEAMASQLALVLAKQHLHEAMQHVELTEQSNQLQRTLLDCVSHELKTPLTVLQTAYDSFEGRSVSSMPAEFKILGRETGVALRRLRRVVDNLLEMTKLESGIVKPTQEWCEIRELLEASIQASQDSLDDRRVEIKINAISQSTICTDPHLLEHILQNLLINAATHSPQDGVIELSATVEKNSLSITVSDHGPGIRENDLPKIFSRFYRGEGSTPGGLGLGLSIVQSMVRALNGTVKAANRTQDTGAIFTLNIPIQSGDIPPQP